MSANPEEPPEEDSKQAEQSYSTRGRTADRDDPLERLARDALGELGGHTTSAKEPSFLSESLTEEERRTRTRYLPEVDGMHSLRKNEVRSDLILAKKAPDSVPLDEEDEEDDRAADRLGSRPFRTVSDDEVYLPSPAFVAPEPIDDSKPVPHQVAAVTAFNPPCPPESTGPKVKHRMQRWENNPADIDVDLQKYRKTVQKTRNELAIAQADLERQRKVDNHLRRHFLAHLDALEKEWLQLQQEMHQVQQDCVTKADLLTSRTRSRGAGKGSSVMKEVLAVLRTKALDPQMTRPVVEEAPVTGLGGVPLASFCAWGHPETKSDAPQPLATSWIVAGDTVATPYGQGSVLVVYPPSLLDKSASPHPSLLSSNGMDVDVSPSKPSLQFDLVPRVAVKLPFGIGFFPLSAVSLRENVAFYSDERLALRWKGLLESALCVGAALNIDAMTHHVIDDDMEGKEEGAAPVDAMETEANERPKRTLLLGSGMIPTATGPGYGLQDASLKDLEKVLSKPLFHGCEVLGTLDNPAVPKKISESQTDEQERIELQAQLLQLRNELVRQKTIRVLNERTVAAAKDREIRVESLVSEMRTDLHSLQRRLNDEIRELGISEEEAEEILTNYYSNLDSAHTGEASPPKRPRRESQINLEYDEEMEDADDQLEAAEEALPN